MHWFWRAVAVSLAAWLALVLGAFAYSFMASLIRTSLWYSSSVPLSPSTRIENLVSVVLIWFGVLTAGLAALRVTRTVSEDQTRCRQCGYILRGLTEPRCPECGERI